MTEITVLYDNKSHTDLLGGWGFSCFIKKGNYNVLFDTGWNGYLLLENMKKLGIDPESIDCIVLSHQHWDHIGGLPTMLHETGKLKVYVPASFSRNLKNEIAKHSELIEVTDACLITDGIWSTGELRDKINEQTLLVMAKGGIHAITGCGHPGVEKILQAASSFGRLTGILGGLHTIEDIEVFDDLDYIAAGHCTRLQKELKSRYPKKFVSIHSGYYMKL